MIIRRNPLVDQTSDLLIERTLKITALQIIVCMSTLGVVKKLMPHLCSSLASLMTTMTVFLFSCTAFQWLRTIRPSGASKVQLRRSKLGTVPTGPDSVILAL